MKHDTVCARAAIVLMLAACAPPPATKSPRNPMRFSNTAQVMTFEQLQKMTHETAFDALRMMPGYTGRLNQAPAQRFALILDGAYTSSLELLAGLRATDLYEIRIVGESYALRSFGGPEIVVTTLARRGRSH